MNPQIYSLAKNQGPAYWFLNQLVIIKASAQETNGAFGLIESLTPVGAGSPYHVHRNEDENFYILEGQIEFISGDRRFTAGPGSSTFLPRNIPHGFRVVGNAPARFLVLSSPAGFESFVMDVGEPAPSLTIPTPSVPDMKKLLPLAQKHHIDVLGPLPE